MPYGNSNKTWDWLWYCIGTSGVVLVVTAAIIGLTRDDTREFREGYRRGYVDGYKKASDDAVEVVERQISEIENRLTNH